MASIFTSVNEIIPDCDGNFLRQKIVAILKGLGFVDNIDGEDIFDGVHVDAEVTGEISQMIIEDLFQNGYKAVSGVEEIPVSVSNSGNDNNKVDEDNEPGPSWRGIEGDKPTVSAPPQKTDDENTSSTEPADVNEAVDLNNDNGDVIIGEAAGTGGAGGELNLFECRCCFCEFDFESMVTCCEGYHFYCLDCLTSYVKNKIQDGVKQGYLECMENDCEAPFARSCLASRIPADLLEKLDERIAAANIIQAELPDLVRCPKCQTQFELPENEQVLACVSCKFTSCRHCKVEWTAEHAGKKCEELESNDTTKARRELEEKMTQAIIRVCPKCKTPLVKNQGCNKLTCSCGGKMCYVCRTPNIDYSHFCNHAIDPGRPCAQCKNCRLWEDPEAVDSKKVSVLEAEAKFIAEKDKLAKLIEMGKSDASEMEKLLEKRKKEEEKLKKELEKPGPSGANVPAIPNLLQGGALLQPQAYAAQAQRARQQMDLIRQQVAQAQQQVNQLTLNPQGRHGLRHLQSAQRRLQQLRMQEDTQRQLYDAALQHQLQATRAAVVQPPFLQAFPPFPPFPRLPQFPAFPQMPQIAPFLELPPGFMRPLAPVQVAAPVVKPAAPPAPQPGGRRKVLSHETGPAPVLRQDPTAFPAPLVLQQHGMQPPRPQPPPANLTLPIRQYANPDQALFTAVQTGETDTIRAVVAQHGQFVLRDAVNGEGDTILHAAVNSGRLDVVECLVNLGCKVWSSDRRHNSPLHNACGLGHRHIAALLVQRGGSVGVPGEFGRTPLHLACSHGHADIVQFLLDNRADINARDGLHGATPLHLAAHFGFEDVVQLLLSRGADINIVDNAGNSPIEVALTRNNAHLVDLFFNVRKENNPHQEGSSESGGARNQQKRPDPDNDDHAPSSSTNSNLHSHKRLKKGRNS